MSAAKWDAAADPQGRRIRVERDPVHDAARNSPKLGALAQAHPAAPITLARLERNFGGLKPFPAQRSLNG